MLNKKSSFSKIAAKAGKVLLLLLMLVFFAGKGFCNIFSKNQMEQVDCASQKMHLIYFYVSSERNKSIVDAEMDCRGRKWTLKIPSWLDETVPSMIKTVKWRDPTEGNLTEADIWQSVLAVNYEILILAKKSFPKDKDGAGIPPVFLIKDYSDVKLRFQTAIDRLYRARLVDSMQGRGRSIMATFTLMYYQLDSVLAALSTRD
jgi:hypothetical protein